MVECGGSGFLETWSDMTVGIKRDLYAGMTKPFLDYLGMDVMLQHQGGVAVPGIVVTIRSHRGYHSIGDSDELLVSSKRPKWR